MTDILKNSFLLFFILITLGLTGCHQALSVQQGKPVISMVRREIGSDAGCWFRLRNAKVDAPVLFYYDAPYFEEPDSAMNINGKDIHLFRIGTAKQMELYRSTPDSQYYIQVNYGPPLIYYSDEMNCPTYPKAEITVSQDGLMTTTSAIGECGCEGRE